MLAAPPRQAGERSALLAAGAVGAGVALQSRVNGELQVALDDTLLAACVSFVGGLLLVTGVVLARPSSRAALPRVRQVPGWERLGGLGGAGLIAVGAAAAPRLGVALLTLGLVAGQTVGGLAVDRTGLTPGGDRALSPGRLGGAALCLLAVALATPADVGRADPVLLALVLVAGLALSVGDALNGRVQAGTGDAWVTTLLNFAVGLLALLVGLALRVLVRGLPAPDWPGPGSWWLYAGGALGICFVAVAAVVVRTLGVLRMSVAVVAGQVLGALLLDAVTPLGDAGVGVRTLLGAALTLVAVIVTGLRGRT